MFRNKFVVSLLPIIIAIAAAFAGATFPAQARAGSVLTFCWTGNLTQGPAPVPTVGCYFEWFPGGPGTSGFGRFDYTCSPNCVVVPGTFNTGTIDLNDPTSGVIEDQMGSNCTEQIKTGTAEGTAGAWFW